MITIEANLDRLNGLITEISDALIGDGGSKADAAAIIHDEARRFARTAVTYTAPPGLGTDARKQGEDAIKRDMLKIFTPVDEAFMQNIVSKFGTSNIDKWITSAGGEKEHLVWNQVDPTGAGMKAFHYANKNSRGRALNIKPKSMSWVARYVVRFEDYKARQDSLLARVGRKKAAWAKSFVALGGKVQRWLARHLDGARGECQNKLTEFQRPSVTMISRAAGVQSPEDARMINTALRIRFEAVTKRFRLIVSDYSKDVARGMKVARKAHLGNE